MMHESFHIENTTLKDLEFVCWLFEEAMAFQKNNNYSGWNTFDVDYIKQDIEEKLQFKIIHNKNISGIFSICLNDHLIWRDKENGDSLYLHRIVVSPTHTGRKIFEIVLEWAKEYAHSNKLKFIRMDTWADNPKIISYYQSYGFEFVENYTTPKIESLPIQHRNLKVALLELNLQNIG